MLQSSPGTNAEGSKGGMSLKDVKNERTRAALNNALRRFTVADGDRCMVTAATLHGDGSNGKNS